MTFESMTVEQRLRLVEAVPGAFTGWDPIDLSVFVQYGAVIPSMIEEGFFGPPEDGKRKALLLEELAKLHS